MRPSQFLEQLLVILQWSTLQKQIMPLHLLMLQHTGRLATPKLAPINCIRYLQTTLAMGKGGSSPLLNVAAYWESSNNRSLCQETVSDICKQHWSWGRGIGFRIYVRYCLKNKWKVKGGLEKPGIFLFKLVLRNVWSMLNLNFFYWIHY